MSENAKPLAWIHGEIKTPPFSEDAKLQAGFSIKKASKGWFY